ncbi:MAG: class I SAM-dependent methyltransferase [Pseudomonadota bacterium]
MSGDLKKRRVWAGIGDRLTDHIARRPSGWLGRKIYRDAYGHQVGFDLALKLTPIAAGDHVLDVGCGGGAFLAKVLARGARAAGVDHSSDMLATTEAQNAEHVRDERLVVFLADASALPCASKTFTHVFCLNAFFFFPKPNLAIQEMGRVLAPNGRLSIATVPPESERRMRWLFGPIAKRMRFDPPEQLTDWARAAGLDVTAIHATDYGGYIHVSRKMPT